MLFAENLLSKTIDEPLDGNETPLIKLFLFRTGLIESLDDERILLGDIDVAT